MNKALKHLDNAQNEINMARALLEGEEKPFARITNAYWENGKIIVEFEVNVDIDILFGFGDKVFSVENNVGEIDQSTGRFEIDVNKHDKNWWVQLVGEVESEKVNVGTFEKEVDEEEEEVELPEKFLSTLWDSWNNDYKDFPAVKLERWGDAEEQYNSGKTIILSASHTWKEEVNGETVLESDHKWRQRLKRIAGIVENFDPNRYLIFLQDEPLGKSHWSLDDLNRLIELSRDVLPDGARIGMSFTNGSVNKRELPTGLDYYVTPNYPFKTEYAVSIGHKEVSTKQEFDEDFDAIISRYRAKIGDKDIHVIAQGFFNTGGEGDKNHERRWDKAPIEYIQWLIEACIRNDIKGAWWWVYQIKRDYYSGLNQMPEFYEEVKAIQNTLH